MSDAPLPNSPEARTDTGEIKDQSQTTEQTTSQEKPTESQTTSSTISETKPEDKVETKPTDKSVIPEKYEFKAPEGFELSEATVTEASTLFKELGLTNDQAQKLVDFQAKLSKDNAEAPYNAYNAMREGWQNEVKADKEVGHILPKVKETISRALDTIASPELVTQFKEAMNLTGSGDHPAFIKVFYKLAQSVVEGHHVQGKNPSPHGQSATGTTQRPSAAQSMYPNLPS